jgi:hypothetical protein
MRESKTLEFCKEIMKRIVEIGYADQIAKREIEKIIMIYRGIDKRTIQTWLRTLEVLGFIRPLNAFVFQLKFDQCPELLNQLVKNGQKKLM